jgi:hypothetical protein
MTGLLLMRSLGRRICSHLPDSIVDRNSGGPSHAMLERRTEQMKRSLFLFDLEVYRRLLTAVALNLILNGLSFVERQ